MPFDKMDWQRKHRILNNNIETRKYEKTINGFLMRCYRNMLSRVTGVTKNKNHLYLGKEILNKNDFYSWSLSNNEFNQLFATWQKSNYLRKLTPSIDRKNSDLGYIISNMRWITFSENCKRTKKNYK